MITNLNEPTAASSLPSDLHSLCKGDVITPDDSRYERACHGHVGGVSRRPAAIIRVADAEDVSKLVRLARDNHIELAIRSGGHSLLGHNTTEGGILLDLSSMKNLDIDCENLTAWADAGLTAGEYTFAAARYGLATGFGDFASVGISGITLGGGVGYLVRKYGMTIDQLLAAEIVTADGELLYVDTNSHPDLFWALRGGGGNFGVVTRLKFQLHKVDRVYGGMLILPATADVIAGFVRESQAAPDELSSIVNIMPAPPMPFLPQDVHGKLVVLAQMVYAGEIESGERVMAPFRALAAPHADLLRPIQYTEMYPPAEGGPAPSITARTLFLDAVDRAVGEEILRHLEASTAPMFFTQLRVLGGAMARVPTETTAFAHRQARIMVNLMAMYGDPEQKLTHETWVTGFAEALDQLVSGAYVNFMGDDGESAIRAAYPAQTRDRLAAIKARYDPTNLFHRNHNIQPAKA